MKKKFSLAAGVITALLVISTAGYSWNYATHAYIAGKIGTLTPILKMNQVYGILAPDVFNLEFSLMNDAVLRGYTHGVPLEGTGGLNQDFMAVWRNADGPFQLADAAGYLAHNDAWGADYIAHWMGIPPPPPFPPGYENEHPGYIIALAIKLDQILAGAGVWSTLAANGIVLTIDERMMFTENIIEYAGDIIIKRADPGIGQKIMEASMVRTPSFWALLMRAFPRQYKPLMKAAEETYQQDMIQYGGLLLADEETIMAVVAQQMAEFSIQYLAYQMGVLPEAFEPFRPQLVNLSALAMDIGVGICASPDAGYMDEVDATAAYVAGQLQARNISSKLLR
jgi:hypothetical protein